MAARIRLLQLAITAVNIVVAALAFTSIWPFPNGDFNIDLPSPEEVTWVYDDGILHVTAPFSIDNGGFYDVDNLTIVYNVTNLENERISDGIHTVPTVVAGGSINSVLDFTFDLLEMYNSGMTDMVFNDDMLRFVIDVSCFYTMKLVAFEAIYHVDVPWEPLINDFGIDWEASNLPPDSAPYSIVFWLDTSSLMSAIPPADLTLTVIGTTSGPLATGTTTITLGGNHTSAVVFDTADLVSYTSFDAIEYSIDVGGFEWTTTVPIPEGLP
ncbi:MAG: hypothetical protein MUC90_07150 [Thermoplasmata archaeon]|jgi:hypothetical protein|nr:hypothetical protein [Thermoplasmata archaeon]